MMALSDQPNTFGTAALAQLCHEIDPARGSSGKDAPSQPDSPNDLMSQLDSHFDNLASVATNSNSALKQLATATTNQYAEIKSSLKALAVITLPTLPPLPELEPELP